MTKHEIDRLIPLAYDVIDSKESGFKKNNTINSGFRKQISSFGAAAANGSLLAAIAFFSKTSDKSSVDRTLLMGAINRLLKKGYVGSRTGDTLFDTVRINSITRAEKNAIEEKVMACALALKLAFNLFELVDENDTKKKDIEKNEKDKETMTKAAAVPAEGQGEET